MLSLSAGGKKREKYISEDILTDPVLRVCVAKSMTNRNLRDETYWERSRTSLRQRQHSDDEEKETSSRRLIRPPKHRVKKRKKKKDRRRKIR